MDTLPQWYVFCLSLLTPYFFSAWILPSFILIQLGVLNGVYTGIGQSVGSLIGGRLCKIYGISGAFRRAAAINTVILVVYPFAVSWVRRIEIFRADKKHSSDTEKVQRVEELI